MGKRDKRKGKRGLELESATLEREGSAVYARVGRHRRQVATLRERSSYAGCVWDSGASEFDEVELYLQDGRLYVVHREIEDVHLAGEYTRGERWRKSDDGKSWGGCGEPSGAKRCLSRVRS